MAAELLSASPDAQNMSASHAHDASCEDQGKWPMQHMPTIFDAIKAGMLIPVQTLTENCGPEILRSRDDKGHTPAHWAALGGHSTILRYIAEMNGPLDDPSDDELAQHPIHWACVNGQIAAVEILLQCGVDIDSVDSKGCTALIVAAQYGQTMLAGYLMGKGARMLAVDRDGDTALHWASFKGHNELMRLLIYSGFDPHQRDNYGQTPLHLTCINGNLTAVQELCEQDKVEIDLADKNSKTPLMLAMGRKHERIISYLKKESSKRTSIIPRFDIWSIIFGPPGNTKSPLLFFLFTTLCWGYPMYIIKCLPNTWYELQNVHMTFMFFNVVMWLSLYHASTKDPGFVPRNVPEYDRAIKEVAHFDEWKQGRNPLGRLCHTCRTVKPMRSKHCRICGRCVRMMDHHCPYIYNCVGHNNRVWFFTYVACVFVNGYITMYFTYFMISQLGWDWLVFLGACQIFFFTGISTLVFTFSIYHAVVNLTTNERINKRRYKYLQDGKGNYHNPYSRGWKSNVLEFLHLKRPLADEDVEYLNVMVI